MHPNVCIQWNPMCLMSCLLRLVVPTVPCPQSPVHCPPLKINPKGVYPMESNVFDVVSLTSSSSHCPLSPVPPKRLTLKVCIQWLTLKVELHIPECRPKWSFDPFLLLNRLFVESLVLLRPVFAFHVAIFICERSVKPLWNSISVFCFVYRSKSTNN